MRLAAPDEGRLRGTSAGTGSVSLRVKVDEHGSPVQATVLQSEDSRLNPVALDAVLRSDFTPARNSGACLDCHDAGSKKAPPFVRLLHLVHLAGGVNNAYVTTYKSDCMHCHKLDTQTGEWSMPSGPEK